MDKEEEQFLNDEEYRFEQQEQDNAMLKIEIDETQASASEISPALSCVSELTISGKSHVEPAQSRVTPTSQTGNNNRESFLSQAEEGDMFEELPVPNVLTRENSNSGSGPSSGSGKGGLCENSLSRRASLGQGAGPGVPERALSPVTGAMQRAAAAFRPRRESIQDSSVKSIQALVRGALTRRQTVKEIHADGSDNDGGAIDNNLETETCNATPTREVPSPSKRMHSSGTHLVSSHVKKHLLPSPPSSAKKSSPAHSSASKGSHSHGKERENEKEKPWKRSPRALSPPKPTKTAAALALVTKSRVGPAKPKKEKNQHHRNSSTPQKPLSEHAHPNSGHRHAPVRNSHDGTNTNVSGKENGHNSNSSNTPRSVSRNGGTHGGPSSGSKTHSKPAEKKEKKEKEEPVATHMNNACRLEAAGLLKLKAQQAMVLLRKELALVEELEKCANIEESADKLINRIMALSAENIQVCRNFEDGFNTVLLTHNDFASV